MVAHTFRLLSSGGRQWIRDDFLPEYAVQRGWMGMGVFVGFGDDGKAFYGLGGRRVGLMARGYDANDVNIDDRGRRAWDGKFNRVGEN